MTAWEALARGLVQGLAPAVEAERGPGRRLAGPPTTSLAEIEPGLDLALTASRSAINEPVNQIRHVSTTTNTTGKIIQLDVQNVGGHVTVTPDNGDRFSLRVGEAISACLRLKADEQAQERFRLLIKRLGTWVLEHASEVRDAYVTTRDGALCFLVVHSVPAYNEAFQDALADLDIELARDPDIRFPIEVMSVPPISEKSMQSFLSPELQLRFGGQRK